MNAIFTRLTKEARALLWPWLCVTIAGLLPALAPLPYTDQEIVSFLVFGFGLPLLATLPFGNEFQHRTLALALSQPASRIRLWLDKTVVSFMAVLSAALVSSAAVAIRWPADFQTLASQAGVIAFVACTWASGTFWTLAARSTLGGVAFNICSIALINLVVFRRDGLELKVSSVPAVCAIGILYVTAMLVVGARKLAHFQATGSAAGDDLLMSGPTVMPESLSRWFRCRPAGALLNLVRKELRLLRPLWLIELVVLLYIGCVAVFRLLPDGGDPRPGDTARAINLVFVAVFCLLAAILAGSLSVGEERTSGTQAWHLTLPVSARRQWVIKLGVVLLAGIVCGALLPFLVLVAGGSIHRSTLLFVQVSFLPVWVLTIAMFALASFWCSCATNGTVRAVLWVFPLMFALSLASSGGIWLGWRMARSTGTVRELVVSWLHLSPWRSFVPFWVFDLLLFVPPIVVGIVQTYGLFRTEPQNSSRWTARAALPLAVLSLATAFAITAGYSAFTWDPFEETRATVEKLRLDDGTVALTGDQFAKQGNISGLTRRWLSGSTVSAALDNRPLWYPTTGGVRRWYRVTIRLASGQECTINPVIASCANTLP